MFKYAKLSFLIFIYTVIIVIFYTILATYINDPLQVWHKPFFRPIKYSHMRESAHARMRNNIFDSIIIGNSWSECTSSNKANDILGGKFINLSIAGSNMLEKKLILERAFKHYKIKKVIYIIDTHYLNLEKKSTYADDWTVLYDDNPFNDINIYLNDKYLMCNLVLCEMNKDINYTNIDKAYDWEKEDFHNRRFGGFENWKKYYPEDEQIKDTFDAIYKSNDNIYTQDIDYIFKKNIQKYFDDYVFQIVKNNPKTEFDFIISPRCNLQLALDIRSDTFKKMKYAITVFALESDKYKNSKLFAFDNENIIGNIKDFKDGSHYKSWINYYILNAIKNNTNMLTPTNSNDYFKSIQKKTQSINFAKYKQIVKEIYVDKSLSEDN